MSQHANLEEGIVIGSLAINEATRTKPSGGNEEARPKLDGHKPEEKISLNDDAVTVVKEAPRDVNLRETLSTILDDGEAINEVFVEGKDCSGSVELIEFLRFW